ncbi:MAG: hypothetical protein V3574_03580 [Candidatus Moraniibacteriota bacterium]
MEKKIDFVQILGRALEITKQKKFLWWFGFFMTLGGGISLSYNLGDSSEQEGKIDEMQFMSWMRKISFYWENYTGWVILGIALSVLILLIFYLWGLVNKGALIDSILKIEKNQSVDFKSGIKNGWRCLGKIFLLDFILFFIYFSIILILIFPVVRLFVLKAYGPGFFLALTAFLIFISFSFLLYFIKKYAEIYLIGGGVNPSRAFGLAYDLIGKNPKNTLLAGLAAIVVNILFSVLATLILFGITIPFILLGFSLELLWEKSLETSVVVFVSVIFFGLLIFINSVYNVFIGAFWVIVFRFLALDKNKEEEKIKEFSQEKEIEIETGLKEEPARGVNNI